MTTVLLLGTQKDASITHGLSLHGQCVGQRYSNRVSGSSGTRPTKQNQNQNPKTNGKKRGHEEEQEK